MLRPVTACPPAGRLSEGNINYMRAFAALAVFLHHTYAYLAVKTPILGEAGGAIGVLSFFVISGYLILRSADRHTLREYVRHRFFRIYPPYIVLFLSIGIIGGRLAWPWVREAPSLLLPYMTLTQHLFPASIGRYSTLHVEWTLTLEVLWYVVAPIVLIGMRRAWWLVMLAGIGLSASWYWLAVQGQLDSLYGTPEQLEALHPYFRMFYIQNAFPGVLGYFLLGAMIYRLRGWLTLPWWLLVAVAGLTLVYYPPWYEAGLIQLIPTGLGMTALLLLLLRLPPLPSRLVNWLSDISYSLYLTHAVLLVWIGQHFGWKGADAFAASLLLSVTMASISYIVLEQPAMRFARTLDWRKSLPTPKRTVMAWIQRQAPAP